MNSEWVHIRSTGVLRRCRWRWVGGGCGQGEARRGCTTDVGERRMRRAGGVWAPGDWRSAVRDGRDCARSRRSIGAVPNPLVAAAGGLGREPVDFVEWFFVVVWAPRLASSSMSRVNPPLTTPTVASTMRFRCFGLSGLVFTVGFQHIHHIIVKFAFAAIYQIRI